MEANEIPVPYNVVGNPAPEFELEGYFNGELKKFSLADYKGKWVLIEF